MCMWMREEREVSRSSVVWVYGGADNALPIDGTVEVLRDGEP